MAKIDLPSYSVRVTPSDSARGPPRSHFVPRKHFVAGVPEDCVKS